MNDEQTVRELRHIVSELTDVEKRYDVATPATSPSAPVQRPGVGQAAQRWYWCW